MFNARKIFETGFTFNSSFTYKLGLILIYLFPPKVASGIAIVILPAMQKTWFNSWVGGIPGEKDRLTTPVFLGFSGGTDSKESPAMWETRFDSWVGRISWAEALAHSSILALGASHGQRPGGHYQP